MEYLYFKKSIAKEIGSDAAVILQNIYFWVSHNRDNKKNFYDDNYWTYNSMEAFQKQFDYLSKRQIERILKKLKDEGYIITGNYNKAAYDRTLWYSLTLKGWKLFENLISPNGEMEITDLASCISPNGEMEITKCVNGNHQTVTPIPNNKPDNKSNNIYINENLSSMSKLYQENIGLANGIVGEYLIEISDKIEIPLFKRALEICAEKGNNNLGYLKGIIKKWLEKNITTLEQLKAYELQNKKQSTNSISQSNKFIPHHKVPGENKVGVRVNETFKQYDPDELEKLLRESQKGKW